MQILRHFQCSFYAILNVVFTPLSMHDLRLESLTRHSLNHRNTRLPGFWDAFSAPCLYRKMRPTLRVILGHSFRMRARWESVSHSPVEKRDALSAPSKKPRLAMESGQKAQLMQLMVSANDPSAVVVRALP